MKTQKDRYMIGAGLVLLAAGLNGLLPLMVTTVYESGGHFTNIMFYKGVIIVPAAYLICRYGKISLKTTPGQQFSCAAIAFFQSVTSLLLYGSYNLISTGMATTLHFMYPVAVLILAMVIFGEKPCTGELVSLIFCVAGVVLLCSTTDGGSQNVAGIPVALLSGVVYAGYLLTIGKSQVGSLPSMAFMLYVFLYNGIFSGIVSVCAGTLHGLGGKGWAIMAISALSAGIVAAALQRGISEVGSRTASILCAAEPLVSVLAGVVILHEPFSFQSLCGTFCVIAAAVLATAAKKKPSSEASV